MPLPRTLAHFNRLVTNRVFGLVAGRVPPWVFVEHIGRRSGRRYQTVVWAFRYDSDLVFALTYGPSADWVRNVQAAGSCRVKRLGRWQTFTRFELMHGQDALRVLPFPIRTPLHLARIHSVLRLGRRQ